MDSTYIRQKMIIPQLTLATPSWLNIMPNKASSQSRNAIFAVAAISIISSYICIFLVNKNFSFTEGWYLSWGGNAAQAYARGMPFPPFYAILNSIFVSLFERIGLDPFAGLRIIGVLIFSGTLYGLYKILNFKNKIPYF